MRQVVLVMVWTAAGLLVMQQVCGTRAAIAVIGEAGYVAGFVIRMLLVIVLLAGAGLLSALGANVLG